MAIVSVRTELVETIVPSVKSELVWLLNDGTNVQESNITSLIAARTVLGGALDAAGSRANARKYGKALNNRVDEKPAAIP
jgi:hypothetical protein